MRSALTLSLLLIVSGHGYADSGVGSNGIDATGLELPNGNNLDGAGIGIGQVEGSRPGKRTEDGGPDDDTNSASSVVPAQVYMGTAVANVNGFRVSDILDDDHGQQVASVNDLNQWRRAWGGARCFASCIWVCGELAIAARCGACR